MGNRFQFFFGLVTGIGDCGKVLCQGLEERLPFPERRRGHLESGLYLPELFTCCADLVPQGDLRLLLLPGENPQRLLQAGRSRPLRFQFSFEPGEFYSLPAGSLVELADQLREFLFGLGFGKKHCRGLLLGCLGTVLLGGERHLQLLRFKRKSAEIPVQQIALFANIPELGLGIGATRGLLGECLLCRIERCFELIPVV